jgi:hypothetical protein
MTTALPNPNKQNGDVDKANDEKKNPGQQTAPIQIDDSDREILADLKSPPRWSKLRLQQLFEHCQRPFFSPTVTRNEQLGFLRLFQTPLFRG